MKNIPIILLLAGFLFSCSDSGDEVGDSNANRLELSRETVNLANTESSAVLAVTSNGDWTISVKSDGNWLSVTPTAGSGNGEITVSAPANPGGETRKGTVTVTQTRGGTTLTREVAVAQLGSGADILLDYPSDKFPYEGGVFTVAVTANVEWEVVIDVQYDWITRIEADQAKAGYTTEDVYFTVAPNYDVERTGSIVFRAVGSDVILSKTAEITQEASDAHLTVGQDEYILPFRYESLSLPIDIAQGVRYEVDITTGDGEDWIRWNQEASTLSEVKLELDDNDGYLPRTAQVKIRNVNLTETVTVFQYGKPDPRIGDSDLSTPVPAFPGAEGGGRYTVGGRGGRVLRVTSLEDDGSEGTLRWAVNQNYPRTIVFDVSGTIELKDRLRINRPYVTIAGQTAPGDGITLKNYQLQVAADEVIIRFIRTRTGDDVEQEDDALGGRYFTNGIVDHCTSSWSIDECVSFYAVKNFTYQWSIASESLKESYHEKGSHGYGGIWGGDNASFHHNLLAHHDSRNPRIQSVLGTESGGVVYIGVIDCRNNVIYNWKGNSAYGGEKQTVNFINNYYKAGPETGTGLKSYRIYSGDPTDRLYVDGNYMTASSAATADNWTLGIWDQFDSSLGTVSEEAKQAMKMDVPFPVYPTTTHSAEVAYLKVADYAGASLRRDAVDQRISREVLEGTYTYLGSKNHLMGIIDQVSDVGGYPPLKMLPAFSDTDGDGIPDVWEDAYGLDKNNPADGELYTLDPQGRFTNLEVYLHNLVQHIVHYQNEGGHLTE